MTASPASFNLEIDCNAAIYLIADPLGPRGESREARAARVARCDARIEEKLDDFLQEIRGRTFHLDPLKVKMIHPPC